MSQGTGRLILGVLLVVHAILALVGLLGIVEWFLPSAPWPSVSNPLFPPSMLLVAFVAMLGAGATFIAGWAARWRGTALAMTVAYAALASLCAIQTFTMLEHDGRFLEMAAEYVTYGVILVFLYRARPAQDRFGGNAA